jgi:hypothetical protein
MRAFVILLVAGVGLALCGCGGSPVPVSGTVTFEGKPLPEGDIIFTDLEGKVAPDAGKIRDGSYSVAVKPGKKKVEIRASKPIALPPGKKGPMGEGEMWVDYIPARYNTKSELAAEVSSASTKHDFALKP